MFYFYSKERLFEELSTSDKGIKQDYVSVSREKYGENKLYEKKKKNIALIFAEQFKDLLVIILIIAAIISFITGNPESTAVILAVLILNAILGTVQYIKAEQSLASLKKLSAPTAKVIRDCCNLEIPASELVVGDLILLDAGDVVPGDGRIIESFSLRVNESALTGESESVEKNSDMLDDKGQAVALGDQKNMVFSGSMVTYGRARGIITAVGQNAELGKIARLMNDTQDKKTPLQITMDNFSKKLSIGIILICALVFGINIYRGMSLSDSLLFAVALAVAAIPEALSSIITISLAIGTSRMAEQNAIIKKLSAVEGLGSVSIICSDKTGTLTQNKMTVQEVFCRREEDKRLLEVCSILCNDTKLTSSGLVGDPTETALVDFYQKNYKDYSEILERYPRLEELPFDSERKLMSTLHEIDGKMILFTKGAIDVMLERTADLDEGEREKILKINYDWSNSGLRVLAFGYKEIDSCRELNFGDEDEIKFLGLINEMDPPREESEQAVRDCRKAGIKPIMITGDHKITASAIARKIGIMREDDIAITGVELDAMSREELMEKLPHISVYARVSPENKIRIVEAWQSCGNIVAMTGDGVNDAPALKSADVGVAMGITGTEVSKDAASMILTDDNFATIVHSVVNGRNIYANIKNAIKFLLSGNAAGIFVVLYAALMALPTPFTAVHLLFINLVTDSLPALAVSMEPMKYSLIEEKPRPRSESVLTLPTVRAIGIQGLLIALATLVAFYVGLGDKGGQIGSAVYNLIGQGYGTGIYTAMTMAFATLCFARLWHGFNSRTDKSILRAGLFSNMYTIGAFIIGGGLLYAVLSIDVLKGPFNVAALSAHQIMLIIFLSFIPTLLIQLQRVIRGR